MFEQDASAVSALNDQIALAAFLIMCNPPELFFADFEILKAYFLLGRSLHPSRGNKIRCAGVHSGDRIVRRNTDGLRALLPLTIDGGQ